MKETSMNHAHEMYKKRDEVHMEVMGEMKELMKDPEAMKNWMNAKKKEFDELPNDK